MVPGMSGAWIEPWRAYARERSHPDTPEEVERKTGISASTVRRWFAKDGKPFSQPSNETVAAFARIYDPGRLDDALIAAARARAGDVDVEDVRMEVSLVDVSDKDLLEELTHRLTELRRLQRLGGHDSQSGLPPHWDRQDPSVGRVQNGDEGS